MVCTYSGNIAIGSIITIYEMTIEVINIEYYPNHATFNITSPKGQYFKEVRIGQGSKYKIQEYDEINNIYYEYTINPWIFYAGNIIRVEVCQTNLCEGVICIDNICDEFSLYEPKCEFGVCVPDKTKLIEINSEQCGYIPPAKKPFPWWLLLLLGYVTYEIIKKE